MTHLMNKTNHKNHILNVGIMALISFMALLSSNVALAGPSTNSGYNSNYQAGHNNYRSSVSNSYRHSQPRIKHGYSKRIKHDQAARRVRHSTVQRRYYSRPHYRAVPVIETHSANYSSSVRYRSSSSINHNNTGAMIVGGVLGGVIANDISGGDGVVTAVGAFTGAVIAGGLSH